MSSLIRRKPRTIGRARDSTQLRKYRLRLASKAASNGQADAKWALTCTNAWQHQPTGSSFESISKTETKSDLICRRVNHVVLPAQLESQMEVQIPPPPVDTVESSEVEHYRDF